jgi:diacylglycerol kinase family enzyme
MDPRRAVLAALEGEPRRIPVGQVTVRGADGKPFTRFFTVAVGVGVDAHLFYRLHSGTKQRLGMAAYYAKAWHLWFTHRMERFRVDWEGPQAGSHGAVTELLAVRIANFGGVLQELAPGASLEHDHLRLVVCRTSSRMAYLHYVARSFLRGRWSVPGVDVTDGKTVRCDYSRGAAAYGEIRKVYVEADGELIGTLPAEIKIVPDALTILAPKK